VDLASAPEAGDIVWIDLGLAFGHEQAGRRPALVLSPRGYNERSSLVIVCPITRNPSPWPFKIAIPQVDRIKGAVLIDQIRSIDREARVFRRAGRLPRESLNRVYAGLAALFGIPVAH
jgi:mRNA interferase MazF